MARLPDKSEIYELAERWKDDCLIDDGSLLWKDEKIWTYENLENFKKCFVEKPDDSQNSFWEKFHKQLQGQDKGVYKLASELLLIHYLFTSGVTQKTKINGLEKVLKWSGLALPEKDMSLGINLGNGIGNPSFYYNNNRYWEMVFVTKVALSIKDQSKEPPVEFFGDHVSFRNLLDREQDSLPKKVQERDMLLHLLYPEHYERIASQGHKHLIVSVFGSFLDVEKNPEDLDEKILLIREKLKSFFPSELHLDFYTQDLQLLCPLAGKIDVVPLLQALKYKKQIVLHGPPGTGKTHEAKEMARTFIRQELFKKLGAHEYFNNIKDKDVGKYIKRVQFHPNYAYEDFVRGVQLEENGATVYKEGVLLQFIEEVEKEPGAPFVMILDEMNRADLSRVLGECFSLLEDRGKNNQIDLAGSDSRKIFFPQNLYFIGTMNEIDQSLEQVDFALRRRFLWFFRGFDCDQLMEILGQKWEKANMPSRWGWDKASEEFAQLAENAVALNKRISEFSSLGKKYEVGHTYFCEIVDLIEAFLQAKPNSHFVMFSKSGIREETIGALWEYSLKPLLEQYLSGTDDGKDEFLKDAEAIFKRKDENN